jgi:hypothetical protein
MSTRGDGRTGAGRPAGGSRAAQRELRELLEPLELRDLALRELREPPRAIPPLRPPPLPPCLPPREPPLRGDGTFAPERRASERPIAIACLRLRTFLPERPDVSSPCFISCIARSTFSDAFGP